MRPLKRTATAVVAVAVAAGLGVLAAPIPAHAAEPPVVAASPWQPLDTSKADGQATWTPNAPQVPSALSTIVNDSTVLLKWADAPAANLGTSIETNNLGLDVAAGTVVSFRYELQDGAECSLSAPRMFVYIGHDDTTPGNRTADAPTALSADCGTSGKISFTIPTAGKIGYAGITYDNLKPGTVKIWDVKIGNRQVIFQYNPPHVTGEIDGCKLTLTFDNTGPYRDSNNKPGPWGYTFDYRLPDDPQLPLEPELVGKKISDPPLKDQPFDGLHNPVPVKAGESETVTVDLEPTDDKVEYRLVRGAEQRLFFDWQTVLIDPDECQPPATSEPPVAGPELPKTGASTTVVVLTGLVLLVAGVVLAAFAARRRRALR